MFQASFQWIAPFDRAVVSALNADVGAHPQFDLLVYGVSANPLFKGLAFVSALWWLAARDNDDPQAGIGYALRCLAGLFAALVAARILQSWGPTHLRPINDATLSVAPIALRDAGYFAKLNSFPSDHAAEFAAMSLAIFAKSRRLGWFAFAWTAVVILLPRLYFGYHYPSDIVAGAVLGGVIMAVVLALPIPRLAFVGLANFNARAPGVAFALMFFVSAQIASDFDAARQLWRVSAPVAAAAQQSEPPLK